MRIFCAQNARASENTKGYASYRTSGIFVVYSEKVHGPDHGLHGHEDVLVYELDVRLLVLVRVTGPVNNPHLLDKRGLPRLSSSCKHVSGY